MITPFWGEFGLISVPMDLSHNYCSTKCAYCFANLNNPNRKAKVKEFMNQMKNYHKNTNFTAQMLRNKMVVNVSNRTDPFALSNYKIAVPQMETLHNEGIPFTIMTRGGKGVDDVLSFLDKKIVWYISITHTSDITRKLVEPGGTTIDERWELVDKLKAHGHRVIVGCNPYFSGWVEKSEFIKRLEKHRPDSLTLQRIHLNYKQIENMSDKERKNMGDSVLATSRKRNIEIDEYNDMLEMYHAARSLGIKTLNYHTPELINDEDDLFVECYGKDKTFRTVFEFVQWCRDNKKKGDPVFFDEYAKFMLKDNPFKNGEYNIKSFLTSQSKAFREGVNLPNKMRFVDVMKIMWNERSARKQINNISVFAELVEEVNNELHLVVDNNDNSVFVFDPDLHPEEYTTDCNM